jgi:hypothetical protein
MRGSLFLVLSLLASTASAATIQTLDGHTYDGDVRIQDGLIHVTPKRPGVSPAKLDLADVLTANLRATEAPRANQPAVPAKLDPRWKTQDVGPTGTAGSVSAWSDGKYAVKGAGANVKGSADSFYFVYQELRGDGQVFARLSDLQIINPFEKAGVMIREAYNERGSRCAFMFLTPQDGSSFACRTEKSVDMGSTPLAGADKPPAWLRITRVKNTFTAWKSMDGGAWVQVGAPQEINMDPRAYFGLAVCSRDTNAACAATFESVTVQPGQSPPNAAPPKLGAQKAAEESAHVAAAQLGRAVVLRSGAVIGQVNFRSADENMVHVTRATGNQVDLLTSEVARLIFAPATPEQLARIPATGAPGVLLAKGDFFEGEFESYRDGRVRINSVIFGPRELAAGSEALIVVLHEAAPAVASQSPWVVKSAEGFVYLARSLKLEKDQFVIEDETGTVIRLPGARIAEFRAGAGRLDPLADLRPIKVDAPSGFSAATAYGTSLPGGAALALDGKPADRPLVCHAGTSLEYDLAARYRTFICRCGVPDAVLPTTAVRLVVLGDGKELYRSTPQTSLDDAASLALNVSGVKTLTLRVEMPGSVNLPAAAVWADAMLVK